MALNQTQQQDFERDGYVVKEGVFSQEDLAPIKQALGALVEREAQRVRQEGRLENTFSALPFERQLAAIRQADFEAAMEIYAGVLGRGGGGFHGPSMLQVLRHEGLLSCIESLVGPDIVGSSVYRVRPKLPFMPRGEVPWHQDSGYFLAHCDTQLIVTCWLPLVDATVANGCLHVLPGVHKEGIRRHYTGGHGGFLEIVDEDMGAAVEPVAVEMKAGDVLFLTNLTPHASFENSTDVVRWSLDLRYQSPSVPNNIGEDPASYTPEREPVTMACYPPEADFVIRDRQDPEREVHLPEDFAAIRQRYDDSRAHMPGRGWRPMAERETS